MSRPNWRSFFFFFSKAFGRVFYQRLLSKLSSFCLDQITVCIDSWLSFFPCTGHVHDDHESSLINVSPGVPLGFVLGPLLFLIFINDIPIGISSKKRFFADDCVIHNKVTCVQNNNQLQEDLEKINNWCKEWIMSPNKYKRKLIHFTKKKNKHCHLITSCTPIWLRPLLCINTLV